MSRRGRRPAPFLMESFSTASVLAFGFVLGVKHAVEADHLAAVSAIVSERRSLLGSAVVGGLWGVGHTLSLVLAGVAVIALGLRFSERAAQALEFAVGVMLVALGVNALRKLLRGGRVHLHAHRHGGREHVHPHLHERPHGDEPAAAGAGAHTHHGLRLDARSVAVGMVHGLAGSAALMLLIVSTIESPAVAFLYIFVFGVGSVGGMMLMSALLGLPLYLTAARFNRANLLVRGAAAAFSLGVGLFVLYEIGYAGDLFR